MRGASARHRTAVTGLLPRWIVELLTTTTTRKGTRRTTRRFFLTSVRRTVVMTCSGAAAEAQALPGLAEPCDWIRPSLLMSNGLG